MSKPKIRQGDTVRWGVGLSRPRIGVVYHMGEYSAYVGWRSSTGDVAKAWIDLDKLEKVTEA